MTNAQRPICVHNSRREHRAGTATVETALVLSFVFVPLLLGFFEFGRVMQAGQVVTTASRYGVRSAILTGSTEAEVTADVKAFVASTLSVAEDEVQVAFTLTPATGNPVPAKVEDAITKDLVQVTVTVDYDDISVVTGKYMNGQQISSSAAMRHE